MLLTIKTISFNPSCNYWRMGPVGRVRNFCAPEHSHGKLICALPVACMGKDQLDGSHENNCVTTRRVSPQFTFLFSPFYKYGACSSAQDGAWLPQCCDFQQTGRSKNWTKPCGLQTTRSWELPVPLFPDWNPVAIGRALFCFGKVVLEGGLNIFYYFWWIVQSSVVTV